MSEEGPGPSPIWACDNCVDSLSRVGDAADRDKGGGGGSVTVVCDPEIEDEAKARWSSFVSVGKGYDGGGGSGDGNNNTIKAIATNDVAVILENNIYNTYSLTYHWQPQWLYPLR